MKIVIVTDAWEPQVNGVVRTLTQTRNHLEKLGHDVHLITPKDFKTIPCPTYPSIRLSLFPGKRIGQMLADFDANAVHIATEGPLGMAARRWCLNNNINWTSSYHTQFPEYVRLRFPIPLSWSYAWLRRFHKKAVRTLVPTQSQKERLVSHGFEHVEVWGRGVDTSIFKPDTAETIDLPKPIAIYMGRVAVEKNIEAFLSLDIKGSKVVVGDGPDLAMLKDKYQDVVFTGAKFKHDLANYLAGGDIFVFPSKTDTFGLVILEAMATGLPVAAYPVTGPKDIINEGVTGSMDDDLAIAIQQAMDVNPEKCIEYAQQHSWMACTKVFSNYMFDNKNK